MPAYPCVPCRRVSLRFVGGGWCAGCMPRCRSPRSPKTVHRTARAGLRVTRRQRHRRAGAHLPGASPSRRDPRRRTHHRGAGESPGRHRPARASPPRLARESLATPAKSLQFTDVIAGRCT